MSLKRSRAAFEAELQAKQSPFVKYGTALPPIDPDVRDDGSFMPVWQQEVRDDKGRKRLHGAFTGGFSAGYFNTVGSKEGWTPSTFVSSRSNRRRDDSQQRVEDYMDEDDLAAREAEQKLNTSEQFSGLGFTASDGKRLAGLMDVLRPQGDTMGVKLLQKMGWRKGQGIGARIRRTARTDDVEDPSTQSQPTHLFAPENIAMIAFVTKEDNKGLGFLHDGRSESLSKPSLRKPSKSLRVASIDDAEGGGEDEDEDMPSFAVRRRPGRVPTRQPRKTGMGMGVIHDNSDEEDAYEVRPKISYNRTIGLDADKDDSSPVKKPKRSMANPLIGDRPGIQRKIDAQNKNLRKCRDSRPPLDGFNLADALQSSLSQNDTKQKYPVPKAPPNWQSTKSSSTGHVVNPSNYVTTGEAAKASRLDPSKRGNLLGEEQLPGRSIFDFMTPEARERIVKATGRTDLPPALSQPLPSTGRPSTTFSTELDPNDVPDLDKSTATAALARGVGGWMPYADDEAKRTRYRSFLEFRGDIRDQVPPRPQFLNKEAWLHELREFAHAARVFKPATGAIASRFTTGSSGPGAPTQDKPLLDTPSTRKRSDPAEEAARLGMFGPLTRSIDRFYPTRLVCKRFNVKPPAHADFSAEATADAVGKGTASSAGAATAPDLVSKQAMQEILRDASASSFGRQSASSHPATGSTDASTEAEATTTISLAPALGPAVVNAERNDALESQKAGQAVFKAIFGSDDEDDE